MKIIKVFLVRVSRYLDRFFEQGQQHAQLNYNCGLVAGGFEINFIPQEMLRDITSLCGAKSQ